MEIITLNLHCIVIADDKDFSPNLSLNLKLDSFDEKYYDMPCYSILNR